MTPLFLRNARPDPVVPPEASARLYSLIETAKANGLEPYAYLSRLFKELPVARTAEDFEALLPFKAELRDDSQAAA